MYDKQFAGIVRKGAESAEKDAIIDVTLDDHGYSFSLASIDLIGMLTSRYVGSRNSVAAALIKTVARHVKMQVELGQKDHVIKFLKAIQVYCSRTLAAIEIAEDNKAVGNAMAKEEEEEEKKEEKPALTLKDAHQENMADFGDLQW